MQNYTLFIVWMDGSKTSLPFETKQLAMSALADIRITGDGARADYTLGDHIRSAIILPNAAEAPTRRKV